MADPAIQRPTTFIAQLAQQCELARQSGLEPQCNWVARADGTEQLVTVPKRVRRWWRIDAQGNCLFVPRYANRVIGRSAHRTAMAVGPKSMLVCAINSVIAVAKVGEVGAVLAATQATFRKDQQTQPSKVCWVGFRISRSPHATDRTSLLRI